MLWYLLASLSLIVQNESARILAVFPTPLMSHQGVHRALIHELVHRNHEVVLITPLPEYSKGSSPDNLMEIDVSNETKHIWEGRFIKDVSGKEHYSKTGLQHAMQLGNKLAEKLFEAPEVRTFIRNNETFDVLLLEAWIRANLFWTYIYDAPVITFSSLGSIFNDYTNLGGPAHPLLYPLSFQHEVWNLNVWQKIVTLYEFWKMNSMYSSLEKELNTVAKKMFGEVPSLNEQMRKIEMLILNIHPVWEGVRPVPMNVVHLGGAHLQDRMNKTEMTEELKHYLDSHNSGVVYVSFGTNVRPWMIPEEIQSKMIRAFSKLPCSVLWKWDEHIKGLPYNVRVGKWFPQAELLKHPNVRLFISQCGQQSTDEAIAASIPVIAFPRAADQWRNAEQLVRYNLGITLDLETIDEDEFKNIIQQTMRNETYRTNMQRMRTLLYDAPETAPSRAVDAIEYIIRHTGRHLASPSVNVSWFQYMEIELLIIVNTCVCICAYMLYKILFYIFKKMMRKYAFRRVIRDNFKSLL